ncbi:MAG: DUF2085 domain-containing protein [Candidatus Altiarchaeota archaeon]
MADDGGKGGEFFENFMNFLEGKTVSSARLSVKLEDYWQSLIYHIYTVAYLVVAFLVFLIFITPFLIASNNPVFRGVGAVMHIGAGVTHACHQITYRSFIFNGIQQPVCSRDIGIYVGGVLGLATVFFRRRLPEFTRSIKFTIICFLPIVVDGFTQTVFHMRESNNILRLLTGLFFAFGVASFFANKLFLWKYPDYPRKVNARFLIADAIIVLVLYSMFAAYVAYPVGVNYLPRESAVQMSLESSGIENPVRVESYYIASSTAFSLQDDPFYGNHRDVILDDIRDSDWARAMMEKFMRQDMNYTLDYYNITENLTLMESDYLKLFRYMFDKISEKEHKFGIWVVAVLDEEPERGNAPFIQNASGEYYYIDAYNGKVFDRKKH